MRKESPWGPAHPPSPEWEHRKLERATRASRLGRGPTRRGLGRSLPWKGPSLPGSEFSTGDRRAAPRSQPEKKGKSVKGSPVAARRKRARLALRGIGSFPGAVGRERSYPATRKRSRRHRMRVGRLAAEPGFP
jgi:hypothetical protein